MLCAPSTAFSVRRHEPRSSPGLLVFAVARDGAGSRRIRNEVHVVRSTQPTWREWHEVQGAPWLCPGGRSPGPAVQGDGGGLLANPGPDRVGTHLRVPVTVLLVLVGHSEGARWAGRERRDGGVVVMRKRL